MSLKIDQFLFHVSIFNNKGATGESVKIDVPLVAVWRTNVTSGLLCYTGRACYEQHFSFYFKSLRPKLRKLWRFSWFFSKKKKKKKTLTLTFDLETPKNYTLLPNAKVLTWKTSIRATIWAQFDDFISKTRRVIQVWRSTDIWDFFS